MSSVGRVCEEIPTSNVRNESEINTLKTTHVIRTHCQSHGYGLPVMLARMQRYGNRVLHMTEFVLNVTDQYFPLLHSELEPKWALAEADLLKANSAVVNKHSSNCTGSFLSVTDRGRTLSCVVYFFSESEWIATSWFDQNCLPVVKTVQCVHVFLDQTRIKKIPFWVLIEMTEVNECSLRKKLSETFR